MLGNKTRQCSRIVGQNIQDNLFLELKETDDRKEAKDNKTEKESNEKKKKECCSDHEKCFSSTLSKAVALKLS